MIKAVGITRIFRSDEVNTTALNNVSLEVSEGEFVSIMGPSGCGKTTLLNIMGLLDSPGSGSLFFMGREVTKMTDKLRSQMRKTNVGFVFQSFNLIDELTVYENVELPLLYLRTGSGGKEKKGDRDSGKNEPGTPAKAFPTAALRWPATKGCYCQGHRFKSQVNSR